ncbi:MAG: MBL fold metallo-hydrolase, partial [Clostridia bacterium]
MVIEKIVLGYLQTNAYVLHVEGSSEAILIDPCEKAKDIEEALEKQGLVVKYVLLTHGHYDHIGACSYFQNRQAKIYIHKNDADKTTSPDNLNSKMYGEKIVPFKADVLL